MENWSFRSVLICDVTPRLQLRHPFTEFKLTACGLRHCQLAQVYISLDATFHCRFNQTKHQRLPLQPPRALFNVSHPTRALQFRLPSTLIFSGRSHAKLERVSDQMHSGRRRTYYYSRNYQNLQRKTDIR